MCLSDTIMILMHCLFSILTSLLHPHPFSCTITMKSYPSVIISFPLLRKPKKVETKWRSMQCQSPTHMHSGVHTALIHHSWGTCQTLNPQKKHWVSNIITLNNTHRIKNFNGKLGRGTNADVSALTFWVFQICCCSCKMSLNSHFGTLKILHMQPKNDVCSLSQRAHLCPCLHTAGQ